MLKELFRDDKKIAFTKIEMLSLPELSANLPSSSDSNLRYTETISWSVQSNGLAVKYTRSVGYDPEHTFKATVEYEVFHYFAKDADRSLLTEESAKAAILSDSNYYVCADKMLGKVSLIVAQLTQVAFGSPAVLPPVLLSFRKEDENAQ